jgi:hypothetical protein
MADFFTRIVERTLGLGPTVRSGLAPLLALPAHVENGGEFAQGARAVAANTSANDEPNARDSEHPAEPSQAARLRAQSETMIAAGESSRRAVEFPEADEWSWQENFDYMASLDFQTEGRQSIDDDSDLDQRKSSSAGGQALLARREPLVAPPSPGTLRQTEVRAAERAARAPVAPIQVTIGRVEVRAVPLPPQRPAAAERKAGSRLSLEQYLRERNEGRR